MKKGNQIKKVSFNNNKKINKYKKMKQSLSTKEIQGSRRQKVVKTLFYNQMLWHKEVVERFNRCFNENHKINIKIYINKLPHLPLC